VGSRKPRVIRAPPRTSPPLPARRPEPSSSVGRPDAPARSASRVCRRASPGRAQLRSPRAGSRCGPATVFRMRPPSPALVLRTSRAFLVESPELGPQPARVLLMCFVRVATRTSRLRHSDFSSRDSADGTCTDGRSSRHDTSLRTRASRWSVSRLTSFDCASSALPSSGSFACPARRSRCRQPLHLFLGRVHSTVRCRDLIAPRPAHGPGSPRRARRRPRGTPRRQLPRAIPSARR
jgi:hypothetical protein